MILVLGASGFVGRAFADELRRRGYAYMPLSRRAIDYTRFHILFNYLRKMRPEFVINAAGFVGRTNEDDCESAHEETLAANSFLPQTIGRACLMTNIPWGHVSSGGIYAGAKVLENGAVRIEKNLNDVGFRQLLAERPELISGFTEYDEPNASFRRGPCSFYSGTKALAEEVIQDLGRNYIWRPGLVFSETEERRNLLSRIQTYPGIFDSVNSLSHVGDFVRACLNLWEWQALPGIYNIVNPGAVTMRQVSRMIGQFLKPVRGYVLRDEQDGFDRHVARTPQGGFILSTAKLSAAGVELRPVEEALEECLRRWRPASRPGELVYS